MNGKPMSELSEDRYGTGWRWDDTKQVTTITLMNPSSIRDEMAIRIEGAGTYEDAVTRQLAVNLRAQVRQVKRELKVEHARVTEAAEIRKPPRVIRLTEDVESELCDMIDAPKGLGQNPPNFSALRKRVLDALMDRPFESDRTVPEVNDSCIATTKKIENLTISPEETERIEKLLRGADLPAWLTVVQARPGTLPSWLQIMK